MALGRGAGRCGGDGGRCSAFPGFSSVRGSSVTKSRSRARPLARGTEGSGLGEHPTLGCPLPSWGTPILIGLEMLLKLAYCKGTWSLVRVSGQGSRKRRRLLCRPQWGLTSSPCRPKGEPAPRSQSAAPDVSRHAFPSRIHSKSTSHWQRPAGACSWVGGL